MRLSLVLVLVGCTGSSEQLPLPSPIASGQHGTQAIATTATDVYWLDVPEFADASVMGRVMRAPLAGGAAEVFADAQPCPTALIAEATAITWGRCDGGVVSEPIGGGAMTMLSRPENVGNFHPIALAAATDYVYVLSGALNGAHGAIVLLWKQPGIGPETIAIDLPDPIGFAADATNFYWLDRTDKAVYQRKIMVGLATPPTLIGSTEQPDALAIDANRVYFVDFGINGDNQLHSIAIGGGSQIDYDTQGSSVTAVAVDASSVYWVAPGMEAVLRAPLASPTSTAIAATRGLVAPAIALTADRVIFADDPVTPGPDSISATLEAIAK